MKEFWAAVQKHAGPIGKFALRSALCIACWAASALFFLQGNFAYGWPPDWTGSAGISLAVAIALFLIPFAQEISLAGILSFKAKVIEIKREQAAFKAEVREQIKMQNSNIASVSNNVTVNAGYPPLSDAVTAEQQMGKASGSREKRKSIIGEPPMGLRDMSSSGRALMVLKASLKLEAALRERIKSDLSVEADPSRQSFGLKDIWNIFLAENLHMHHLNTAMVYINDIRNATVHMQKVPLVNVEAAITLAEDVLRELEDVPVGG